MPDFETRMPPDPGRAEKIRASTPAASGRLGATAVGILRSMNRHRWATVLGFVFVMVFAASSTVYWLNYMSDAHRASESWPPDYSEGEDPSGSGYCPRLSSDSSGTTCYYVYTNATDEKSLIYITKVVSNGSPYADVRFYNDDSDSYEFAEGCKQKHLGISIAYSPDTCS